MFAGVAARAHAAMEANRTADSPIESILGAAIILCFQNGGRQLTLAGDPDREARGLLLVPQFKWAVYRSDWAIYNPKTSGALLIECDGKEFHSTPDRISHDARKDQAAHDHGYLTMRFTGAQINRSADDCAREIFDFVYGGKRGSHS
jgi:very-short-patch-repair endonuclease